MDILERLRISPVIKPACHLLRTHHSTVVGYDGQFGLIHTTDPNNPAVLYTFSDLGCGLMLPVFTPPPIGARDEAFVLPFYVEPATNGGVALRDPMSGRYLCVPPPVGNRLVADRPHRSLWETFATASVDRNLSEGHAAFPFLQKLLSLISPN